MPYKIVEHRGLWSLVPGIVVLQAASRDTWKSAVLRVLETLIGAMLSGFYLYLFPFRPAGMATSVGLTVLCTRWSEYPITVVWQPSRWR